NDHFTAGPHCRVMASGERRVAGSYPTIGSRIVSPADVRIAAMIATPDDHLTATPHCRVKLSAGGCIGGAGICPSIRTGLVCRAQPCFSTQSPSLTHPSRSSRCQSTLSSVRSDRLARWWCWWLSNYPCRDCTSRQCSTSCYHHIHPRRSFRCPSRLPCDTLGQ